MTYKKDSVCSISKSKAEYSVDLWIQGYNCSESVVMAFADDLGLDRDMASGISSVFGFSAGFDRERTCGVVTGALMVIGLKYGAGLDGGEYEKDRCALAVQEFITRFLSCRKSILCKKVHLTYGRTPEKLRHLKGEKAFCAGLTKEAAEILESMFAEEPPF